MFFRNRQKELEKRIAEYQQGVLSTVDECRRALHHYCGTGDFEALLRAVPEVHSRESRADDLRREIENIMFAQALFPESRGDILRLVETMDKVANRAEDVVRDVAYQYLEIPEALRPNVLALVDTSARAVAMMVNAVGKLFCDFTSAAAAAGKTDELESAADRIEAELVRQIFSGPWDGMHKILLRDLTHDISGIADAAEVVADLVRLVAAKRMI